jgi:hypothetical protein
VQNDEVSGAIGGEVPEGYVQRIGPCADANVSLKSPIPSVPEEGDGGGSVIGKEDIQKSVLVRVSHDEFIDLAEVGIMGTQVNGGSLEGPIAIVENDR